MGRPPKAFAVTIVSFALLYYGVAWAVLRCSYDETRSDHEITRYDRYKSEFDSFTRYYIPEEFDCVFSVYHTHSVAEYSSLSHLKRLIPGITLPVSRVESGLRGSLWLTAIFDRSFGISFLIDAPRYLSLSRIRI